MNGRAPRARRRPVVALLTAAAAMTCLVTSPALATTGARAAAQAATETAANPGVALYQAVLDSHLTVVSAPGEGLETRFHYRNLRQRPGYAAVLARVRRAMFDGVTPSRMPRAQRMAWAINAYNFLVIEAVTENFYHPRPHQPKGFPYKVMLPRQRVQEIRVNGRELFDAPVVEVEGKSYTLNTFERTFVFEGFDHRTNGKPPRTLDPRAHFALVCAAQGCPPLQPRAFLAESLDAQLDAATRQALANKRHLNVEPNRVEASPVFAWYAADFGGPEGAFAFVQRHAPAATRDALKATGARGITSQTSWDWTLNQTPLPEYQLPPPGFFKEG